MCERFWLRDYFPEIFEVDRDIFPDLTELSSGFRSTEQVVVAVPADCRDGFLGAYWKRPKAYLDPDIRASISTFSRISDVTSGLERLRRDIASGDWHRRYSMLHQADELDLGYRIVIGFCGRR